MNTNTVISGIAAEDLSGKEHFAVKLTSTGLALAGGADRIIGTILRRAAVGKAVDIFLRGFNGLAFVQIGNDVAISIADELEQMAGGKYIKKAARNITAEADDDVITSVGHALADGVAVTFPTLTGGTGLTALTQIYYVRDATANTFKVALSPGGTAVDITADATAGTVLPVAVAGIAWEAAPVTSAGGAIRALLL